MRNRIIIKAFILSLLFPLILTSCKEGNAEKKTVKPKKKTFVSTQLAVERKMVSSIEITGTVEANTVSEVKSPVDGVIESLSAHENEYVKKGDIIAVINPNERLSLVASNKLLVQQLKNQLETSTKDSPKYMDLKEKLIKAQKDLDYAQKMYQSNPVVCPMGGMITVCWLDKGSQVSAKEKIISITDMSSIVIKAEVNEKYFSAIKKGKKLPVILNAYPNETLKGVISLVYPQIDPKTRSVTFDIQIKNFNEKLLPGMMATIKIPVEVHENAIVVKEEAVLSSPMNNKKFIFVVNEGNKVEKRLVETGISSGKFIEITKGLKAKEAVVVKGQEVLKDGMVVKVLGKAKSKK